jgi:hypothetical protein
LLRAVLTRRDVEAPLRARGLGGLHRLLRHVTSLAPDRLTAAVATAFVPSIAIVARA